jgi:hypothetical protein
LRFECEYPYNNYYGNKVYSKKDGRYYVAMYKKNNHKETTSTSYARYLMSIKEKKILEDWEKVDHINNIKNDDRIENLQILSQKDNSIKYVEYSNKKRILARLKCPECKKIFEKNQKTYLFRKKANLLRAVENAYIK